MLNMLVSYVNDGTTHNLKFFDTDGTHIVTVNVHDFEKSIGVDVVSRSHKKITHKMVTSHCHSLLLED